MAIFFGESLDCGFAIDHCRDYLTLFSILLGADDDVVAVADCDIDHGVAYYFKEEELALAYEGLGEWEDLFDVLFGEDWTTGSDTAHQWDIDGLFGLNGVGIVGVGDLEGTAFGGVFADKAFFNEGFDLILNGGGGGEASCLADLTH